MVKTPENPFDLLPSNSAEEVTSDDMRVILDEIRAVVRDSETRGMKGPELQSALDFFDNALKKELQRISGPGSKEEDFIGVLPHYREKLYKKVSEGLRVHLTGFFRENGIHFDRSVFSANPDKRTTFLRSLYIQAFLISLLENEHLIDAKTATDEKAALKLTVRYGIDFVNDYFHGSFIQDTLNSNLQEGEAPWTESEVAELFTETVRKRIAVGNIASVKGALERIAENVRFLRDNAKVAEIINATLKPEEKWTESEVAKLFQEGVRKYIAVYNIASVKGALERIAENVRFLRDNAKVAEVINGALKPEEKWTEEEVAELFQEWMLKHIAVHNIASVKEVLGNLRGFLQNDIHTRTTLSAQNKRLIERKFGIQL